MSTPIPSTGVTPLEVAPGLYQVPLPVEGPLRAVNCYVAITHDSFDVIDCGFHTPATEAAWHQALADLRLDWSGLRHIYVTHYHPDHFGAAGWLQAQSGAPVLMLDREIRNLSVFWDDTAARAGSMAASFHRYGMPQEMASRVAAAQVENGGMVLPLPETTPLSDGDEVQVGSYRCRVIWTPGHADGMYMLWAEAPRILLSADHILPKITPNISYWPQLRGAAVGYDPDPLETFLTHVQKTAALSTSLVLPGHRYPFADVATRCQEIVAHHDNRLAKVLSLLPAGQAVSAWDVSGGLFGTHWEPPQQRFAMAETLAHLVYLQRRGRVRMVDEAGFPRWERVS